MSFAFDHFRTWLWPVTAPDRLQGSYIFWLSFKRNDMQWRHRLQKYLITVTPELSIPIQRIFCRHDVRTIAENARRCNNGTFRHTVQTVHSSQLTQIISQIRIEFEIFIPCFLFLFAACSPSFFTTAKFFSKHLISAVWYSSSRSFHLLHITHIVAGRSINGRQRLLRSLSTAEIIIINITITGKWRKLQR